MYHGLSIMGPDLNKLHNLFRCYHLVVNCAEHVGLLYRVNCTVSYVFFPCQSTNKYSINRLNQIFNHNSVPGLSNCILLHSSDKVQIKYMSAFIM